MRRLLASVLLVLLLLVPVTTADLPAPVLLRLPLQLREAADALATPAHAPAPAAPTNVGPGTELFIQIPGAGGGSFICTANFVWAHAGRLYLGAAGHCFLPHGEGHTHGPSLGPNDPLYDLSNVTVQACVRACNAGGFASGLAPGTLRPLGAVAYARANGVGEDFGLVEIPASGNDFTIRRSLPVWGGPTSAQQATDAQVSRDPVCHYGNGVIVGETFATKARAGVGNGIFGNEFGAFIAIEGGDSGSALVTCGRDADGLHGLRPVGVITHGIGVAAAGVPVIGFGTTVTRSIEMAKQAGLTIALLPE